MKDTWIENVSDTAFWIAHCRALETERANALFRDPLAGLLAGDRGRKIATAVPMPFTVAQIVVIRTYVIDDYIRFATTQGVDTVLNLGAGFDTRPYRMNLPDSLRWIEVDYPHVIQFKEKRLSSEKPCCQLERVKLDLTNLSERRKVFASINGRAKRMLVLTEGLVSYLSVEEVGSLADDLRTLDRACYWVVEYFSPEFIKYRKRSRVQRKMQNAPFKFTPKDWFGFFGEHGWHPKEIHYLAEEAERLHRPIQLPGFLKFTIKIRSLFASDEQRLSFKRFQGYVMLEPGIANRACGTSSRRSQEALEGAMPSERILR
jgi:methyltransferase (TIGR00027 family)